jgi:glucose/arabinose dehydrogenase
LTARWAAVVAASVALGTIAPATSGEERPRAKGLRLATIANLDKPTFLGAPRGSGDLAYVTERAGKIVLLDGGREAGIFLDMRRWAGCCEVETGLFSVAFPRDYARSRRFYVYFTNRQDNIEVDEFRSSRKNPRRASARTRRKVIEIPQDGGNFNHNGGQVAFGPDGLLYLATGDGGNFEDPSANAQRKGNLLGKLLRIDPTPKRRGGKRGYGIPASNPLVGKAGRGEIYARGLRNPFRFSFDGGRVLIGDVGQDRREEVDVETVRSARGANFGWNVYEGTKRFSKGDIGRHAKPAFQYAHNGGACSIVGGYVMRDPSLKRLRGRYVYGDYCSGELRSLRVNGTRAGGDRSLGIGRRPGIVSFGLDARERLYVIELESGRVSRLVAG